MCEMPRLGGIFQSKVGLRTARVTEQGAFRAESLDTGDFCFLCGWNHLDYAGCTRAKAVGGRANTAAFGSLSSSRSEGIAMCSDLRSGACFLGAGALLCANLRDSPIDLPRYR